MTMLMDRVRRKLWNWGYHQRVDEAAREGTLRHQNVILDNRDGSTTPVNDLSYANDVAKEWNEREADARFEAAVISRPPPGEPQ